MAATAAAAIGVVAFPVSAAHASVNPAGWFWSWSYVNANQFSFVGAVNGAEVSGSGGDTGGTRSVTGSLIDLDPNDDSCAEVTVIGPARNVLLRQDNCNRDPVPFDTGRITPSNNSNQVVFDLRQVKTGGGGAEFRDRIQSSIHEFGPKTYLGDDDTELRDPATTAGWSYTDDRHFFFWAHRPGFSLDGDGTDESDGTRTASATVTVPDIQPDQTDVTGYLWGDRAGGTGSPSTNGDPRQVTFGRSMLTGNLYYEVQRYFHAGNCCAVASDKLWDLTGKVTLPGSGM